VALLIDYGLPRAHLYHPERSAGTLRCHFRIVRTRTRS
jgi:SAM-dependent MidA family methyltransferase